MSSASFKGRPSQSLVETRVYNLTIIWLLNGFHAEQTTLFHVQGDTVTIPVVLRCMGGRHVTYTCYENINQVMDVNKTVNIMCMSVFIYLNLHDHKYYL